MGRRIIGKSGSNMKDILKRAGQDTKLRLRGKGSGYSEQSNGKESEEPLQLCISCIDSRGYDMAIQCVDSLLRRLYADYDKWSADQGLPHRAPQLCMREGPSGGSGSHGGGGGGGSGGRDSGGQRGRNQPPKKKHKQGGDSVPGADEDKGEQPDGAPEKEEIEDLIEQRNEARRAKDFRRADEIRDDLQKRKVVLCDERGAQGNGSNVTGWRYWRESA